MSVKARHAPVQGLCCTVKNGTDEVPILTDVSGYFRPGELAVLMG